MARTTDGTATSFMNSATNSIFSAPPLSVLLDFMPLVPSGVPFCLLNTQTANWDGVYLALGAGAVTFVSASNSTFQGGTAAPCQIGNRNLALAVWASTSSRQMFCAGVAAPIDTVSNVPVWTASFVNLGFGASVRAGFDNNTSAVFYRCFIWNAVLDSADYQAIFNGQPPELIRPNLLFFRSYFNQAQSSVAVRTLQYTSVYTGETLTSNGTIGVAPDSPSYPTMLKTYKSKTGTGIAPLILMPQIVT